MATALRTRLASVVSAASLGLGLAACSGEDPSAAPTVPPAATVTVTTTAEPASSPAPETSGTPAALTLETSTSGGSSCTRPADVVDLGWYDATFRASQDLTLTGMKLVGATGIRVIGTPQVVPARNFGGRIDLSGEATWPPAYALSDDPAVLWAARDTVGLADEAEGATGVVLLHLRFDPTVKRADLGTLRATYETADGVRGSAELALPGAYRFSANC